MFLVTLNELFFYFKWFIFISMILTLGSDQRQGCAPGEVWDGLEIPSKSCCFGITDHCSAFL